VKSAFQSAGGDASVGQLRNTIRSGIRRDGPPARQPVPREQAEPTGNEPRTGGGGNDYAQQLAEERRKHRQDAFASPIFAQDAPTGKPVTTRQEPSSVLDLLSGVDLSGLSPRQTAQLKRYLQVQQSLEGGQMPALVPGAALATAPDAGAVSPADTQRALLNAQEAQKERNVELNRASGPFHKILPGAVVEAALDTALESSMTGVVLAHFTRDVHTNNPFGPVLIPAGSQLVGSASPVTSLNQPRLKVAFDLIIEPNGYTINLDQFEAMNQKGETGLADSVNSHWLRTIGIAVTVGLIEGLSESTSGVNVLSSRTEIYNGVGSEAGREGVRILDRFLNVPPAVTVNPGSRIRIVFPIGLDGVPEYQNTEMEANL
jgi:type IV secretion system protein VirB10